MFSSALQGEIDPERIAYTIILTQQGVANLKIELAEATERTFEETLFAIGRIEAIPRRRSVLSSRIPGRVVELNALLATRLKRETCWSGCRVGSPVIPRPSFLS